MSDKLNIRAHIIAFNAVLMIIGVAVLGFADQPYVRYFGAFLVTAGKMIIFEVAALLISFSQDQTRT